jgi:hypothetical protein
MYPQMEVCFRMMISQRKKPKKAEAPVPAKSKFEFKGFDPNNPRIRQK